MCEQMKSLDINARGITFYEKVSKGILEEVVDILMGFIEFES